jgi:hypothetical protein
MRQRRKSFTAQRAIELLEKENAYEMLSTLADSLADKVAKLTARSDAFSVRIEELTKLSYKLMFEKSEMADKAEFDKLTIKRYKEQAKESKDYAMLFMIAVTVALVSITFNVYFLNILN